MLEQKWPQKYNEFGHLSWRAHLYGQGLAQALTWGRGRLYQGMWGDALSQALDQQAPNLFSSLHLMPEWYLIIASLAVISVLSIFWSPLLLALPALAVAAAVPILQAVHSAYQASLTFSPRTATVRLKRYLLTVVFHFIQPIARLYGRLSHGLTPWRWRGTRKLFWPRVYHLTSWSKQRQSTMERLETIAAKLRMDGKLVHYGGDVNRWNLQLRGGMMGSARILLAGGEGSADKQTTRFRIWPVVSVQGLGFILLFAVLAGLASLDHAWIAATVLGAITITLMGRLWLECSRAVSDLLESIKHVSPGEVR